MPRPTAYIALGSNIGDRRRAIESALAALAALDGVEVVAVSSLMETMPEGPPGQGRYLNAAAILRSDLEPRALLEAMLSIEADHGRDRRAEQRWGPRRLDLDLLMYDDRIIDEPGLTVPHPRMHARTFVLEPLVEIAAAAVHPGLGVTIECLRNRLASRTAAEYEVPPPCCQGEPPSGTKDAGSFSRPHRPDTSKPRSR
ncbi:MAG: 2-amino-4-hydroxy-6-hydroxymethyldihydropteridine diphosphokinase [Planctomycetota bacterium]